jgi:response regulator RpfG family c-di-GMP phosphodiesterase
MPITKEHTILLVDDEAGILHSLQRLLRSVANVKVLTAANAEQGLVLLKNSPISLIVSDHRMPGMTGVEFLTEARAIRPETIRILLTGYADLETPVKAINNGSVRYYITKPWDNELLLSRIKESLELYEMMTDNRRLDEITRKQNEELRELNRTLEHRIEEKTAEIKKKHEELSRSFMQTIKAFSAIIEIRNRDIGNHSQRVASLVKKMLGKMNLGQKEYQDIVVAAFLHDVGKVSYPDALLKKKETTYTRSEMETVSKHPILGQSCVFFISGFEDIGLIIRHHHENFRGGGYPDDIQADTIPLGSRLIRIADAFDHWATASGHPDMKTLNDAAAHIVRESGSLFDPELVKRFIDLDIAKQYYERELAEMVIVKAIDLEKDMVVAEDIYTQSGMFVLPRGARLSSDMIGRIIKIDRFDSIAKGIAVYKQNKPERKEYVAI